jgi:hypothetical protein
LALKGGWIPEVLLKPAAAIICPCFVDEERERLLVKRFWPRSDCSMGRDAAAIERMRMRKHMRVGAMQGF